MQVSKSATDPDANAETILIVEDDPIVRATLARAIADAGRKVLAVASVAEANARAQEVACSAAVVDMLLPDGRGEDVIRFLAGVNGIPVVVLTAYADRDLVDEAIAAGAMAYLVKPVLAERLLPTIDAACSRHRERSALQATNEGLAKALEDARAVSIAIGIMMERFRIGQQDAFENLRSEARARRAKINDLAAQLIAAAELLRRASGEDSDAREPADRAR